MLRLSPTGAPQKLTYLQLDSIHSSSSLSLGNLTQPHVLWMHLQLVGIHCIFMPFRHSVKFTDACKRCWRNKFLRDLPHDPTFLAHPSLVATTIEVVNCNPICVAEAGGPTFTITFSSNTTPLKEEIDYAGMSPVSSNPSRIEEFQRQLLSSSWPLGEMEKRNNTVPTLQSGKSFVIRGKSVTFSHL